MKQKKKASYDKPATIIGKETILESATLRSKNSVQVNGKFYGNMEIEASLVVGESGYIEGNVVADFLLVAGQIQGNVDITGQLHLTKTSRVSGDIQTTSIIIDEGASIDGNCHMKSHQSLPLPEKDKGKDQTK